MSNEQLTNLLRRSSDGGLFPRLAPSMSISHSFSRRPSAFAGFGPSNILKRKGDVDIVLEGQEQGSCINSYSTHDEIKGQVVVSFERDTRFDDLMITFEGQTLTYVEKIATTAPTTGRTTGKHTFLKLLQPANEALLPEDHVARAGVRYEFPFQFVVPDRLLPHICQHSVSSPEVKDAHLTLPPSFGDPMLSSDSQTLLDDLAPDMARISYNVRVKMIKRAPSGKYVDVADKAVRVRLVPKRPEQPPVQLDREDKNVENRKEKDVKKGIFKIGKVGRLVAETSQPASLQLPPPRETVQAPISTMTCVSLRFDPIGPNCQPPILNSIVSKLRAETFFGATPYRKFPSRHTVNAWDTMKGFYSDSVELSTRSISTVTWTRHDSDEAPSYERDISPTEEDSPGMARRPSVLSTMSVQSIPDASSAYAGSHFYTASVLVPIALPKTKSFPPSFHSCIVSRSYILDLNISYHGSSGGNVTRHIALKVPIQVSSEGSPHTTLTETEAEAEAARQVDMDFFSAMGMEPPSPQYTERQDFAALGQMRHQSVAAGAGAPPAYFSGYRHAVPRSQSVSVRAF